MLKPTIHKLRGMTGRAIRAYRASIGPLEYSAATQPEAIDGVERNVISALDRLDSGVRIGRWNGHVYFVAPAIDGWVYWVDTCDSAYVTSSGYGSREHAERAAYFHLAQNLWTPETDDYAYLALVLDRGIRLEIASWIGFQRAYRQIQAAGELTDHGQIHQAACNAGDLYTREHFASI